MKKYSDIKLKLFIIAFCVASMMSCGSKNENAEEKEKEVLPPNTVEMNNDQYKMAGIQLGMVEYKDVGNILRLSGMINVPPQNLVSVSAQLGGYIKSSNVIPGSPVRAGQVLAVIENPEFIELQQNYLESKSQLEYAEAEYNRQKQLYNEKVSSQKSYQLALSEYNSLNVKVKSLEQKLALIGIDAKKLTVEKISRSCVLVSPISGYVKAVNVNTGKYVNPTDVLFEIINNQKLTLELTMFEKDINKITMGQKIRFTVPDQPSLMGEAKVMQIGRAVNNDKTVKIYATVEGNSSMLMAGMYVSTEIETGTNNVTAMPKDAVITYEDKSYIFVFKGKRKEENKEVSDFLMVEVQKGMSSNGYTEIILPDNFDIKKSQVVIKGAFVLMAAMKNAGEMSC